MKELFFRAYESCSPSEIKCRCTSCFKVFGVNWGIVKHSIKTDQMMTCSVCGTKTLKPIRRMEADHEN